MNVAQTRIKHSRQITCRYCSTYNLLYHFVGTMPAGFESHLFRHIYQGLRLVARVLFLLSFLLSDAILT
jgi:hypothetical protein